jgi:FkbM family methyltransferase
MTLINKKKKISNITSIFIFTILILVLILVNKYKGYLSSSFFIPLLKFPFKYRFKLYNDQNVLISNLFHEPLEQALIAQYLKKSDSVLELGGNIGGASILINKITDKPHIVFEPSKEMVHILKKNRKYHNCDYKIVNGILSKPRNLYLHGSGVGLFINSKKSDNKVETFLFNTFNKQYKFNALIADCEGSLEQILNDFPTLFDNMRLVIFEKDGNCNYDNIINKLLKLKFKNVVNTFHDVWINDNN